MGGDEKEAIKACNREIGINYKEIIKKIDTAQTVTSLWNDVMGLPGIRTFERFTLSLDLLFALGLIEFQEGLLRRVAK